jgi:hypothetical protein
MTLSVFQLSRLACSGPSAPTTVSPASRSTLFVTLGSGAVRLRGRYTMGFELGACLPLKGFVPGLTYDHPPSRGDEVARALHALNPDRSYFSMTPQAMRAPEFPAGSVL